MDLTDPITDLLVGVLIDVTAEQVNALIKWLIGHAELVASGQGMEVLAQGFVEHGIDPDQLTNADWYRLGESLIASTPRPA